MIVILDSNEYINFLNGKSPEMPKVLGAEHLSIHVNELMVKEVLRNVSETAKKKFYALLLKDNIILHEEKLPKNLLDKHKKQGLKKGDIAIAAFCDNLGANYLISENRHFLKEAKFEKLKVLRLNEFLRRF